MRILHINDHLALKGGVEAYLLAAIPRLEAEGWEQAVVFGAGDANLVKHAFHVPQISEPGWGSKQDLNQGLEAATQSFQPDVVHLHGIYNADAIDFVLDRLPVVLTSHDFRYLCPNSSFFYRRTTEVCQRSCGPGCFAVTLAKKCLTLRPKYSWKYYQRVQRVRARFQDFKHLIAPGQDAAQRFTRDGFPADKVTVLPYFCRIAPLAQPRPMPPQKTILFLGRLAANKGWEYFMEALGQLPSDVHGVIIGNVTPGIEQHLKTMVQQFGCQDRLTWRNWATQEEISEQLQKTSVLVFPSLWPETLGIVGLEAMAHGVPVVASGIGGVPEWLKDGQTGFTVEPKDAAGIADRIAKILDNDTLAQNMSNNALNYLKERFLPEQHLTQLRDIYSLAAG